MATLKVNGVIIPNDYQDIYDWFGIDAVSPRAVSNFLAALNGESVDVEINSGGGDVFSGSEIYAALKSYIGNVTTQIVGVAASAASVIAMGGNTVMIAPTGQMMIHNVSAETSGDYRDMQHSSDILKNANMAIANAYQLKTGMDQAELLSLMDAETWLNAQQAKEKGFVDGIMFDNENKLVAATAGIEILPAAVINKVRNVLISQKQKEKEIYQNRLNLLKLQEGK